MKNNITIALRVDSGEWTDIKSKYPRKVNKMFKQWVSNCGHSFSEQELLDIKRGLHIAMRELDKGSAADLITCGRIDVIYNKI